MPGYWELVDQQPELIKSAYESSKDVADLAIDSWEAYTTPSYFESFKPMSFATVMYKAQADAALKQAITSILLGQYSQALYNLRYALENLIISIHAYVEPFKVVEEFNQKGNVDSKIKRQAIKFFEAQLPERSAKLLGLKKQCDLFGTHQNASSIGRNFILNKEEGFELKMYGTKSEELDVGLLGIVAGLIVEYHYSIQSLDEVEWITVTRTNRIRFKEFEQRLNGIKAKYEYLWRDLIINRQGVYP